MKSLIVVCLLALAVAAPFDRDPKTALILRDDRIAPATGSYSTDIETENGIYISEGGQPGGEAGAVSSAGEYSFPLPNGEIFSLKYVANENGFQPESAYLPVAPAFPHPIPQFVLDQIAFAEQQRQAAARGI